MPGLQSKVCQVCVVDFESKAGIVPELPNVQLEHLDGVVPVPDGQTELPKIIKHGSMGEVIEATWNGTPCAIKMFTRKHVFPSTIQKHEKRFEHEIKCWAARLRHPNVVQFLGLWEDKDKDGILSLGLVMERMHTDLHAFITDSAASREIISMEFKRAIMVDITLALKYIHSLGIYHLDLTPGNVLLTRSFKAKLADFGIAKDDEEVDAGKATVTSGTNDFMPPEAFPTIKVKQKRDFNFYTDSFSFGCLVLFMLTHCWPTPLVKIVSDHETGKPYHMHTEIERRQHFLADLTETEKVFEPLILDCLKEEPADRPSFSVIHDQLVKANSKMVRFTDTNVSHQVFSEFALHNNSDTEQPIRAAQEDQGPSQHNQQQPSASQRWDWGFWSRVMVVVLSVLAVLAAYMIGGWLRSDSSI